VSGSGIDVTIQDLRVTGATGDGIHVTGLATLSLTLNRIQADANADNGIDVSGEPSTSRTPSSPATPHHQRRGVNLSGGSSTLTNVTVAANIGAGLAISGAADVTLINDTVAFNIGDGVTRDVASTGSVQSTNSCLPTMPVSISAERLPATGSTFSRTERA